MIENRLVPVRPLPTLGVSPRTLRADQITVPVGTSGRLALASFPKSSSVVPGDQPATAGAVEAAPVMKSAEAGVVTPSAVEAPQHHPATADTVNTRASATSRLEPPGRVAESRRAAAVAVVPDDERAQKERAQKEKEVVLAVLQEYSRAYERMDVRATKAVYPSVDDRSLRRAFDDLKGQQLHFASCGVSISSTGAGANAWCTGDATFRPKIGPRQYLPNREWTFTLGRDGAGWQILKASVQ